MDDVGQEDIQFLDTFFSSEELSDEGLKELDRRLKRPSFKKYYEKRLKQKYEVSPLKLFFSYLPMIILISLTIIGIYLILIKA